MYTNTICGFSWSNLFDKDFALVNDIDDVKYIANWIFLMIFLPLMCTIHGYSKMYLRDVEWSRLCFSIPVMMAWYTRLQRWLYHSSWNFSFYLTWLLLNHSQSVLMLILDRMHYILHEMVANQGSFNDILVSKQNSRYFADDISKSIFAYRFCFTLIEISPRLFSRVWLTIR